MADFSIKPPTGYYEGYLKKRKNIAALTLLVDWNKRYFCLDAPKYSLVYYKDRKRSDKPSEIDLTHIMGIKPIPCDEINDIIKK